MNIIEMVAINGVTRNFRITKLFINPISKLIPKASKAANPILKCQKYIARPNITQDSAAVLPTLRSITPEIRQNAIPTAIMPV